MRNIEEKKVQKRGIEFLRQRYEKEKLKDTKLSRRPEEYTLAKKRADGFFCLHNERQRYFVASLEAKSYKTLHNLKPIWNDERTLLVGSIVALILSLVFWTLSGNFSLCIRILTLIVIWPASIFGYLLYSELFQPVKHKRSDVFKQIEMYPANEQWLAVSKDSLILLNNQDNTFRNQSNDEALIEICKKKGIGLLVVNQKSVTVELEPKYRKGNFLQKYLHHNSIKEEMDGFERQYSTG